MDKMMALTKFDLEQCIMDCWQITNDLNILFTSFDLKELTEDEIQNCHLGLITLYNLKFERLWDTFEKSLAADPEIKAKREKYFNLDNNGMPTSEIHSGLMNDGLDDGEKYDEDRRWDEFFEIKAKVCPD
jgi:hypothetical protein